KKVWNFLKKQSWVDKNQFIVAGHSQGAREAVAIAHSNKSVTQIGLFGYDPKGRFEQEIRRIRKFAETGSISWEEADSLSESWLKFYETSLKENEKKVSPGLISWISYNIPSLPLLLELKIPVYIAYGSADIVSDNCDLLPFYFSEKGKSNLTLIRYAGLEHNFFPLDSEGNPD